MTGLRIELFLVDGIPGGITTAHTAGWTGSVLVAPRSRLDDVLRRPEVHGAGVCLLLTDGGGAGEAQACSAIGPLAELPDAGGHPRQWERLVVVTASDDALTPVHWAYLRARLVELSARADGALMAGTLVPDVPSIREAQVSDVEAFLNRLRVILLVLGVTVIPAIPGPVDPVPTPDATPAADVASRDGGSPSSPVFVLADPRRRVDARAQARGEDFVLLAGSLVVPAWENTGRTPATKRSYAAYKAQYDGFVADGSITVRGGQGRLTRDLAFRTPSSAGAIAIGHSCNGPTAWTWEGGTYAHWARRRSSGTDE